MMAVSLLWIKVSSLSTLSQIYYQGCTGDLFFLSQIFVDPPDNTPRQRDKYAERQTDRQAGKAERQVPRHKRQADRQRDG